MVSKIEILQYFYQIYPDKESEYFIYDGKYYYLAKANELKSYYHLYMQALNLQGFQVVNNCFNQVVSRGYILFTYQNEQYNLNDFLIQSSLPLSQKIDILKIKESWCIILDKAKKIIGKYASRTCHFEHFIVLSYYYQGLGECAINVLNQLQTHEISTGIEHFLFEDDYAILCNPSNFIVASRIKDLTSAYKKRLITIEQLEYYINYFNLSNDELKYLYARILFCDEFFKIAIKEDCSEAAVKKKLIEIYQNIDNERQLIKMAFEILHKYINIPFISWL